MALIKPIPLKPHDQGGVIQKQFQDIVLEALRPENMVAGEGVAETIGTVEKLRTLAQRPNTATAV